MTLISKANPTSIAGIPVDTAALADLEDGDIVAFRYEAASEKFVAFRMARHEDHKLTMISNGDFIHLNAAP